MEEGTTTKSPVFDFGIKHPLFDNQFKVYFDNQPGMNDLTNQITSASFDFVNNTLSLSVEHPVDGDQLLAALKNLRKRRNFSVYFLKPNQTFQNLFCLVDCLVTSHKFKLDYASNNTTTHMIEIKFGDILGSNSFTIEEIKT